MKIRHQEKKLDDLVKIRNEIHLNPAWQRGPVWTVQKQALLIDSILRGYDIPMIYLRVCPPKASFKYEVVDGQQRLRAIWDFLDEKYALPGDAGMVGKVDISAKRYGELTASLKGKLTDFVVVLGVIKDAREPEISQLFSRMQMGVRLNPPELRNAVQTGLRHAVDGAARLHPFFRNSRISPARFKYQDYLAHAISICLHDSENDLKAGQLMDDYTKGIDSKIYVPLLAAADEILNFLEKANALAAKRITQKWIFVDLFYLLYQNIKQIGKLDAKDFSEAYLKFDNARLINTADPSKLVVGKSTQANRDLYDYIQAFKVSGAERKNLKIRSKILKRYFKTELGI